MYQQPPNQPQQTGYPHYPQQNTYYPPQQPFQPPPGYPPQQQGQWPQPPKKKRKKWPIILLVIVVIVAVIVLASSLSNQGSTTTSTSNTTTTATQAATGHTASQQATWKTTHTFTGNGSKKTETIAVGDDWKMNWSCNHSSFQGLDYNVIITVYNSDATIADSGVNATCKKDSTSGSTEIHTSGNVYLDVVSEGSWNIQVQELK